MSDVMMKACEECGEHSVSWDSWLTVSSLEIRLTKAGDDLIHWDEDLDFCSPGCLLRYVSKSVNQAMACHDAMARRGEPTHEALRMALLG